MRRHAARIISALLIMVIAMSIMQPLRAVAQPGNVTISGQVTYQPRNWNPQFNNWATGREIEVDLYERDHNGHDTKLDTTYTDFYGNFSFQSRLNWWGPDSSQLNVVLNLVTVFTNTEVTNLIFADYAFASLPTFLSHDGNWTINFPLTLGWLNYQAVWIFEDIRNAWNYVHTYDDYYDPQSVTAVWQSGIPCYPINQPPYWLNYPCGSFTWGGPILRHFIFIADSTGNINSMDVDIHETGHMYMVNANGYWYYQCPIHSMFVPSDIHCAWTEGWADFFPLAVNGDHCYNSTPNSCQGIVDHDYYDLEAHSRKDNQPWGDTVEGRVAATLYDFYDSNSEGFDRISAGFYPIADFALGITPITSFSDFWNNHWEFNSGQNSFLSGLTMWWNTIDYIYIQQNYLPTVMKQP